MAIPHHKFGLIMRGERGTLKQRERRSHTAKEASSIASQVDGQAICFGEFRQYVNYKGDSLPALVENAALSGK